MKTFLFFAALLQGSIALSQITPLGIEWQKSYGGSRTDLCNFIQQTSDKGYILAGWSRSPNDGDVTGYHPGTGSFGIFTEDNWVVKIDSLGAIEWQNCLGGTDSDAGASITQTADGGYITLGQAKSTNGNLTGSGQHGSSFNDYWLVKLTSTGAISWSKCYGGTGDDVPGSTVTQTADGGYIMAGKSNSTNGDVTGNHGGYDCWVLKVDNNGVIQWQKSLGGTGVDYGYEIEQTSDGSYVLAGYSNSNNGDISGNNGDFDYWVAKLDNTGNLLWQNSLGGSSSDQAYAIEQTVDGGYIVAGQSNSNNGDVTGHHGLISTTDYWVVKLNNSGNLQWQKSLGGTANELAWTVHKGQTSGYVVTGYSRSINGDISQHYGDTTQADFWIVKLDDNGNVLMEKSYGGSGNDIPHWSQPTIDGGYILAGESTSIDGDLTINNGGTDYWVVKLYGEEQDIVTGKVYFDYNENCLLENNENGVENIRLVINPGNIVVETNSEGAWFTNSLPAGNYTISIDSLSNWVSSCGITQSFNIPFDSIYYVAPSFGVYNTNPCSKPNISITSPFIRRCFSNQKVYVRACNDNNASGVISSAYSEISLDPLFIVESASIPYTDLGGNLFRFEHGDILPGECANFTITAQVSCNAIQNQTLCLEANLFPVESCAVDTIIENPTFPVGVTPCNLPWDRSSLSVNGWCANDSVYFTITNTGELGGGDMDCYSPVRIYIDGQMFQFDSIMILGGQTVTYAFAGTGQTWRLEADQHPLHPGHSRPNANVELCGDAANWTPGLVTILPQDDADPVKDIYCGIVTGSYDPNDKQGFPSGITASHFIMPNQNIEYLIRFQNTGNDTAFTVVIRDTLDFDLDIFSVVSGVSSHNYNFTMHGPRVLEWTFNNIMLPDSTTNSEASNGFVTFTVKQNQDLPNGSQITNKVGIYFDFNDPIITNQTLHTINSCIQNTTLRTLNENVCESYVAPDGQVYTQSGTYTAIIPNHLACDSIITINLLVNNVANSISQNGMELLATQNGASYQWIDCANNNEPIIGATNQIYTVTTDGEYAVEVTYNNCTEISECLVINGAGMKENINDFVNIYPNPTHDVLHVVFKQEFENELTFFDVNDKLVFKINTSNKEAIIPLQDFPKGVYFLKIKNKGQYFVQRIVKI